MTSREFEIRPSGGDWLVYVTVRWGPELRSHAGGLACSSPFPTSERAMAWVLEQFSVPRAAWARDGRGSFRATI